MTPLIYLVFIASSSASTLLSIRSIISASKIFLVFRVVSSLIFARFIICLLFSAFPRTLISKSLVKDSPLQAESSLNSPAEEISFHKKAFSEKWSQRKHSVSFLFISLSSLLYFLFTCSVWRDSWSRDGVWPDIIQDNQRLKKSD